VARPITKAPPWVGRSRTVHVEAQLAQDRQRKQAVYISVLLLTLVTAAVGYVRAPEPFPIALLALLLACTAAFLRPAVGLYLLVFFTMVGDSVTMPWWPFTKNMSSRESILFVNDRLILNPLEVLAGVTLAAFLMQRLESRTWRFERGRVLNPLLVVTFFVFFGFIYGYATGGDLRVALFESRPLLYILLTYVLVTNLLSTRRQYVRLLMTAMVAVSIQSIFSLVHYLDIPARERAELESLSEHAATVAMNALFVLLLCAVALRCSRWLKWSTFVLAVPVVVAYLLSQRRAAMVALVVGVVVILAVLFQRRRRAFWFVTPTLVVLATGFVLATWNARGALGLPASAAKTVLFPNQLAEADSSSDLYRRMESYNLQYTIRSFRVFGRGFGQEFLRPVTMPDISFFEFWKYIPHNNVLWLWVKMGFLGFAAMMYAFGRSIQLGARSLTLIRSSDHVAFAVLGVSYVAMFLVFSYVDIAYNARCTVFLGVCMALCADFVQAYDIDAENRRQPHFEMVPQ
jgi:hypothetical protein